MWKFRAMTTDITVAAPRLAPSAERALAASVAAMFADVDRRFSRFRDDSELARLNRAAQPITTSREMIDLLCAAREHVAASNGLFDPTIGAALCAAGYDRSFAPGALDRPSPSTPPRRARFAELEIDERNARVTRPAHIQIDLGGFLKGRTVDRAAAAAPAIAMIDAGGDAMLRGDGPDGDGWLVDVEDPHDPRCVLVTLRIRDRAVATSADNRRCWRSGHGVAHHLIDPRSGAPAISDLAQVTVVAASAEQADVLAKVAFLRGAAGARELLCRPPANGGVLVSRGGDVELVGELEVANA